MRRIAILLVPFVATAGAAVGSVMTAAPAHAATPLIQATVTVNQPPVNSLLSLCLSSASVHPIPACIVI
jgi:hypothetical protein